jgi:hypothetical protein
MSQFAVGSEFHGPDKRAGERQSQRLHRADIPWRVFRKGGQIRLLGGADDAALELVGLSTRRESLKRRRAADD